MTHFFKLEDADHAVALSRSAQGYVLHVGGQTHAVELVAGRDHQATLWLDGVAHQVVVATRGDDVFVHLNGAAYQLRYEHPLARLAAAGQGNADDQISAPMPGSIVSVAVAVGDAVKKGQTLLVMESMKMETTLSAPRDGVVEAISFEQGQTFDRDAVLLRLQAQD
ncbi:acetyl-CoA carboxylase biotin carboxyl carrier protein subunit [Sinimarinibacterium sp. NLF-5-8]|uniref:acetyl-CoA carboxylase biotin carboxyl carrier protein subunit n=1 Tax=Sinimarinibacterium sp. NLF-5-8 TaxID=2698684 RepID=UPI00137C2EB8|nr:acetyl-CoA carboxylase biotin carboxyl carrier protein subunit [Sinimarinibacterium sp. NLF-5-8]QHS10330.1 biotin/lipoyl-binding protein [Sinimarinibacterium sp. NLF-5-8]